MLSNPFKTRAIADAKIKSDKFDASTLADLVRADLVAKSYVPPKEIRDVRALLRHRCILVNSRTAVKNRIHSILDKYNMRCEASDLFGLKGSEWLRNLHLPSFDREILELNLEQLENLDSLIESADRKIATIAISDRRINRLIGFTGLDYYAAMVILYEVGDVKRFPNPEKLVSWAGLCPSLHQSGNSLRTGSITKKGNKWVRWVLIQAAQNASRFDPRLKPFYDRVSRRRGSYKAVVAVARKILVSAYFVLMRDEPYNADREDLRAKKIKRMNKLVMNGVHA